MKREELTHTLQWTKQLLEWETASSSAKEWWEELESINEDRVDLVLKLASELLSRQATIDDFFLACSYSNREGVQENLRFLDVIKQDRSCWELDESESADDADEEEESLLH